MECRTVRCCSSLPKNLSFVSLFTLFFFFIFHKRFFLRSVCKSSLSPDDLSSLDFNHKKMKLTVPITVLFFQFFALLSNAAIFSSSFIHSFEWHFFSLSYLLLIYFFPLFIHFCYPPEPIIAVTISFIISYRLIFFVLPLGRFSLVLYHNRTKSEIRISEYVNDLSLLICREPWTRSWFSSSCTLSSTQLLIHLHGSRDTKAR